MCDIVHDIYRKDGKPMTGKGYSDDSYSEKANAASFEITDDWQGSFYKFAKYCEEVKKK